MVDRPSRVTSGTAAAMAIGIALATVGCSTMTSMARTRAADALGCPETGVVVEEVAHNAYRVTGCDQTVSYQCAGYFSLGNCQVTEGPAPTQRALRVAAEQRERRQVQAAEAPSSPPAPSPPPEPPPPPQPVVEMFKGQAALCAKAARHSTSWDMQSCDDLERVKRGEKPANDFDDWFSHQNTNDLATWLALQKTNKSSAPSLIPIGRKAVLGQLKAPSTARFASDEVALQCPDKDTFITVHEVDAQNGFGAMIRDHLCVAISLKDKNGMITDCGALANVAFNLATKKSESLPTNVRLTCELPAKLLHMRLP